jgi:hypothetical protein
MPRPLLAGSEGFARLLPLAPLSPWRARTGKERPAPLLPQAIKVYRAGRDEPVAAIKSGLGGPISGLHW